MPKVNHGV